MNHEECTYINVNQSTLLVDRIFSYGRIEEECCRNRIFFYEVTLENDIDLVDSKTDTLVHLNRGHRFEKVCIDEYKFVFGECSLEIKWDMYFANLGGSEFFYLPTSYFSGGPKSAI